MFENDIKAFSFRALGGLNVTVGYSVLLLFALYASLSQGMNPDALRLVAILLGSTLLAGFVQAGFAAIQGVEVTGLAVGGSGIELVRKSDQPAPDEFLIAAALPVTHLALFGFFGLASNIASDQAAVIAASGGSEEAFVFWRETVLTLWLIATVNFFLGFLHLLPAYPLAGGILFHQTMRHVLPEATANYVTGFVGIFMFLLWIPLALMLLAVGQAVFLRAPCWDRHMALMNNQTQL